MGEWLQNFPEILIIDGIYFVNKIGMPLYALLMIENGYGHGQVVHYAATSSEDSS